jgi:hypothetical protein
MIDSSEIMLYFGLPTFVLLLGLAAILLRR